MHLEEIGITVISVSAMNVISVTSVTRVISVISVTRICGIDCDNLFLKSVQYNCTYLLRIFIECIL